MNSGRRLIRVLLLLVALLILFLILLSITYLALHNILKIDDVMVSGLISFAITLLASIIGFSSETLKLIFAGWLNSSDSYAVCRVLVFGRSGSGKTTLVRQILEDNEINAPAPNKNFAVAEGTVSVNMNTTQSHIRLGIEIGDYAGEKPYELWVHRDESFFGSDNEPLVNTIIFVADLFPESINNTHYLLSNYNKGNIEELIKNRLQSHIDYFNKYSVQSIFATATSNKHTFAFRFVINKLDLLRVVWEEGWLDKSQWKSLDEYALKQFDPIVSIIRQFISENGFDDSTFKIGIVSGQTGENVKSVFGQLWTLHIGRLEK